MVPSIPRLDCVHIAAWHPGVVQRAPVLLVVAAAAAVVATGCAHDDADVARNDHAGPSHVDPCDAPIDASIVDDVALDADRHYVVVDVASRSHHVDASLWYVADARAFVEAQPAAPTLPPGPVRDAPAHPPRDVLSDLIA